MRDFCKRRRHSSALYSPHVGGQKMVGRRGVAARACCHFQKTPNRCGWPRGRKSMCTGGTGSCRERFRLGQRLRGSAAHSVCAGWRGRREGAPAPVSPTSRASPRVTSATCFPCHLATNNTLLSSLEKSHKCQAQGPDVPRDATHLASESCLMDKPGVEGYQSVRGGGHLDLDGSP